MQYLFYWRCCWQSLKAWTSRAKSIASVGSSIEVTGVNRSMKGPNWLFLKAHILIVRVTALKRPSCHLLSRIPRWDNCEQWHNSPRSRNGLHFPKFTASLPVWSTAPSSVASGFLSSNSHHGGLLMTFTRHEAWMRGSLNVRPQWTRWRWSSRMRKLFVDREKTRQSLNRMKRWKWPQWRIRCAW